MATGDRIYLGSEPSVDNHTHWNGAISTSEYQVVFPFAVKKIIYISNDDTSNDLLIAFNGSLTTSSEIGLNGVIRLKPGEVLNDFRKNVTSIRLRRTAGSGTVRILGV